MKLRIQSKLLLKQRIHSCIFRSSHQKCSVKQYVLRNFAKFRGKHLRQSLFFNKVAGTATLLKKRLLHRCFPVNFAKFLQTPLSQKTSGRLLLYFEKKDVDLFAKEFKTHVHRHPEFTCVHCYREFTRGFNNGSRASVNYQNHSDNVSITFSI